MGKLRRDLTYKLAEIKRRENILLGLFLADEEGN